MSDTSGRDGRREGRVLLVCEEAADAFQPLLERAGYEVHVERDRRRAMDFAAAERPDVVVADLQACGRDGLGLIEHLVACQFEGPVVALTGEAASDAGVEALRLGATDYLSRPFAPDALVVRVERALRWSELLEQNRCLRETLEGQSTLVGDSPAHVEVMRLVDRVAPTDARVLIVGEAGTGKELVARTLHRRSQRRDGPFVALDCGLPEPLLESELFGPGRGARARGGCIESAARGTLFLDAVQRMGSALQARLARALQQGAFVQAGDTRRVRTDARILATSDRDPRDAVAEGCLREDLFDRLGGVQITLPPLRERASDIPLLAAHFVATASRRFRKRVAGIDVQALHALERHAWPGNVRELENAIERAIIVAAPGASIGVRDLPLGLLVPTAPADEPMRELRDAEREILLKALRECHWNRSLAARRLGIGRRTLYDKLARHGISLRIEA